MSRTRRQTSRGIKTGVLHVTSGDVAAGMLRKADLRPVLPWRDVLHEGPVFGGLSADEFRRLRASHIATRGWDTYANALASFVERDRTFDDAGSGILWFEHDLYDQLQLVELLARLALKEMPRGEWRLVQAGEYLGGQTRKELHALLDEARPIATADAFAQSAHARLGEYEAVAFAANPRFQAQA